MPKKPTLSHVLEMRSAYLREGAHETTPHLIRLIAVLALYELNGQELPQELLLGNLKLGGVRKSFFGLVTRKVSPLEALREMAPFFQLVDANDRIRYDEAAKSLLTFLTGSCPGEFRPSLAGPKQAPNGKTFLNGVALTHKLLPASPSGDEASPSVN